MFWQHSHVRILLLTLIAMMIGAPVAVAESEPVQTITVLVESHGTDPGEDLSQFAIRAEAHGWQRLEVPLTGSVDQTIFELSEQLGVRVQVERSYRLLGPESEPMFGDQWALENTGQSGGTPDADIDARSAWDVTRGNGSVVAIIDSGIDPTRPEIDAQLWTNAEEVPGDGKDNDGNGYTDDVNGWDFVAYDNDPRPDGTSTDDAHGTLIAGVIAAEVNGSGITGLAPEASLMNIRACDTFCDSFDVFVAMAYAVDNGADVINLSFGAEVPESEGDWVVEAGMDYALENDVLVVTAAGNTAPQDVGAGNVILPAEFPHSNNLAVAASDRNDSLAEFSYYSPNIDVAAPGVDILSIGLDGFYTVDGTSFSAPHVAALAALLLSKDSKMSHSELVDRIKGFSDKPANIGSRVESGRINAGSSLTKKFIDTVGHLFETDIDWAADQDITRGCNPPANTRFCPNDTVTREVMAAFLNRYLDLPAATKDYFDDDNGSIFEDDINRLAEAGITKGCGTRAFCPKNVVDRGQMAAFLVRAFGLTDNGGGDHFIDDDDSIFEHDIDRLRTAGITKGCNPPQNDRYCPNLAVDRGAMTAFLHRAPTPP